MFGGRWWLAPPWHAPCFTYRHLLSNRVSPRNYRERGRGRGGSGLEVINCRTGDSVWEREREGGPAAYSRSSGSGARPALAATIACLAGAWWLPSTFFAAPLKNSARRDLRNGIERDRDSVNDSHVSRGSVGQKQVVVRIEECV